MANNRDHEYDNQGNGGSNGRFAGGDKPGGKFGDGDPEINPDVLFGTEVEVETDVFNDDFGDHMHGTDGNDTMDGLGGDDVLLGHQGNDLIAGNAGNDNIGGGAGNDTLSGDGEIVEIIEIINEVPTVVGYEISDTDAVGSDTFSHSGDVEKDGTDEIVDFDCAEFVAGETVEEDAWAVTDVIELDVTSFEGAAGDGDTTESGTADSGIFGNDYDMLIDAATLADYLWVTSDGDLVADLDGTDTVDAGNPIVLTDCADGVGVAVEINDQTFVWDGAGWTDDIL